MFFRLFILFSVLLTHFGTAAPNVGKISANILQQQLNAEYVVVISDPITSADLFTSFVPGSDRSHVYKSIFKPGQLKTKKNNECAGFICRWASAAPKTLAMLQRCPQIHSVSTVVPKVNGYSGSYTPNWAYYYHNSSPPYRNSYYDLCNVYWHHKYPACPSDWHSWVPA
uniref:Secreted protein n=1 Tax=Globodera rostochiensis TaxID=31243 RepID=A0A914ID62_GLORO